MEVNTLTKWISIGKDLSLLGKIDGEVDRIEEIISEKKTGGKQLSKSLKKLLEQEGWILRQDGLTSKPRRNFPKLDHIDWQDFVYRSLRRFGKGFGLAWAGRSCLDLLVALVKSKGNPQRMVQALKQTLVGQPLWYGLFLGSFLCIFETTIRYTQQRLNLDNSTQSMLAGALSGLSLFWLPKDSRVAVSLFFLVRAIEVSGVYLANNGYVPHLPHADTVMMSLASGQVIWGMFKGEKTMDPSYYRFLDYHAGHNLLNRTGLIECADETAKNPAFWTKLNEWRTKMGFKPIADSCTSHERVHAILHPQTTSCLLGLGYFIIGGLKRALPVYLPVHLIPLFIFKSKDLIKKPLHTLLHSFLGIARSSFFLAMYCGVAWYTFCKQYNAGLRGHLLYAGCGFGGGAMVILEKKGRRIELALYVLSHAIQSFYNVWQSKGYLPYIKHGEVLVFAVSVAILLSAYLNAPLLLRRTYFSLLRFFFGSGAALLGFPDKQSADEQPKRKPREKPSTPTSTAGSTSVSSNPGK